MTINVTKGRDAFPAMPDYISDLTDFVIGNISEKPLIYEFCFVIDQASSKNEFEEYNNVALPQTELEHELMELLDNFYKEADKEGDVDNKRGNLLEHLVYQMSLGGKYAAYRKWFFAILDIIDTGSRVLFSIRPHNIDFYFEEESQDDRVAIDCKVKVFENKKQLRVFDNLAKEAERHGISCLVGVVHLVRGDAWREKYKTWYQKIEFIGPDDLQDRLM